MYSRYICPTKEFYPFPFFIICIFIVYSFIHYLYIHQKFNMIYGNLPPKSKKNRIVWFILKSEIAHRQCRYLCYQNEKASCPYPETEHCERHDGHSAAELLLASEALRSRLPLDTQGWIQLNRKDEVVTKVRVIS